MGEYDLFDLVVVSCDFNTKKPHRETYQKELIKREIALRPQAEKGREK